jgi:ribonucleoside-diphosphate reductase alpha chain
MPREPLPDRREVVRQKVTIEGTTFYLEMGMYPDGRLGEIFIKSHRDGSFSRGVLDVLARVVSLALQHGVPVAEVVCSMRGLNFPPQGVVTGSAYVAEAVSVSDWVSKEIAVAFLPQPIASGVVVSSGQPL